MQGRASHPGDPPRNWQRLEPDAPPVTVHPPVLADFVYRTEMVLSRLTIGHRPDMQLYYASINRPDQTSHIVRQSGVESHRFAAPRVGEPKTRRVQRFWRPAASGRRGKHFAKVLAWVTFQVIGYPCNQVVV